MVGIQFFFCLIIQLLIRYIQDLLALSCNLVINICKSSVSLTTPTKAREQYEHSSAKYYYTGEQGIYLVTNFMKQLKLKKN